MKMGDFARPIRTSFLLLSATYSSMDNSFGSASGGKGASHRDQLPFTILGKEQLMIESISAMSPACVSRWLPFFHLCV